MSPAPLFPRVLYVSTHGWNPGDNFIQMGVERLLEATAGRPLVSGVYNKAPQVTSFWRPIQLWRRSVGSGPWSLLHGVFDTTHFDNSHKRGHGLDGYDAVVFSGSPGWSGPRLRELYRKLDGFEGTVLFLGIGTPNRAVRLGGVEARILRSSLVVTREEGLADALRDGYGIEASTLPCPALFSAPPPPGGADTDAGGEGPVGFVFSTRRSVRNQAISRDAYERQIRLLEGLRATVPVELVCHYSDDLADALERYGGELPIHHHFDARALLPLFRRFSYVVSTRVHGCGAASSLGIPNALIGHDRRAPTVRGFLSERVGDDPEADLARLTDLLRPARSQEMRSELRRHRARSFERWCTLLARHLGTDPPPSRDPTDLRGTA